MNNRNSFEVLICWQTRTNYKNEKASQLCRDFGLKRLLNNAYLGILTNMDQMKLYSKLSLLLMAKTDAFHFLPLCKSCFDMAKVVNKQRFHGPPPYEIVG